MFCGCFVVFCGCCAVLCECFAVFPQNTQNTRKTSKNTEKHKKTHNTLVYCGRFQRVKNFHCIAQNTFYKTSAKHRKTPQNTAKESQNAYCEITSQNTTKQTQNAQKVTKPSHYSRNTYCAHSVYSSKILQTCRKSTQCAIRVNYGLRGVSRTPAGGHGFKKTVFCGVLRCFAVFCVRVFSVFHKTDPTIYKTHKTNKIRFVQYSALRCCAYFSYSENVYKKHSQNTSKTSQNIRKTPQNTAKHCFSKYTRKTPQNTRKTPAKHRKTLQNTTKQIC